MSDYYTVSQYAKTVGKDPGNIRRMLLNGALYGEKIGNQWVIPKSIVYPSDRRIKSGNFKNWRKLVKLKQNHPEVLKKLYAMSNDIGRLYAEIIECIVLYGSYARGEETSDSDIDMAIVFNQNSTEEQYDKIIDIVVDYELDLGITLSVVSIEQKEFLEWKNVLPFYKNVDKEGIVLWKSA